MNKIPSTFFLSSKTCRRKSLLDEYYQTHHQHRDLSNAKDKKKKTSFFRKKMEDFKTKKNFPLIGIDLGCRGGAFTEQFFDLAQWHGVDIDQQSLFMAQKKGLPISHMDISVNIDFQDNSFHFILLTEVLEHLPYPPITIKEIHRIIKKGKEEGYFFGSVPIDYNINQKIKVMRGKRLEIDPTHLHSFSFRELDTLLKHYFHQVDYLPLHGRASKHIWLSFNHFVRDIAWVAKRPKEKTSPWKIRLI